MADDAPAAKRTKRFSRFEYDYSSCDNNSIYVDSDRSTIFTSDESENDWSCRASKNGEHELNFKPLLLKVPRGKAVVPASVQNPGSALISNKQHNEITPDQFNALNVMPLEHICIFAETSTVFKDIAMKFFAMKYRNMKMELLANPITGKIYMLCFFFVLFSERSTVMFNGIA